MERNNIVGNGPRAEPLGIMIGGPTGVGKSLSVVPIMVAVGARVIPEAKLDSFMKNHADHIWHFIPENPFHDAYHG
jgi:pantothenate kinase-related protein Tda10